LPNSIEDEKHLASENWFLGRFAATAPEIPPLAKLKPTLLVAGHTATTAQLKPALLPMVQATAVAPDTVVVIFMPAGSEPDTINIEHSLLGYNLRRIFFRHDKGVRHCLVCHAGDGDASSMRGRPIGSMETFTFSSFRQLLTRFPAPHKLVECA
jgi:hypothetical protein